MTITIRDLVNSPDLGIRVLAGANGMDNCVTWAHVCELRDPTEWLTTDELLLTIGYSVPEQPAAQQTYINRLAQAGISGIVIAEGFFGPTLSTECKATADQQSFPILLNTYDVPYTSIVRAVADANRTAEHSRLLKIIRVYEQAKNAADQDGDAKLVTQLGNIIDSECFIVNSRDGRNVLPGGQPLPRDLFESLQNRLTNRTTPFPALLRLDDTSGSAVAISVPASHHPILIVRCPTPRDMPHTSVLHHIAAVTALEVEKITAEYDRKRELGAELLAGLIDARLATDLVEHMLSERGLSDEPHRLAVVYGDLLTNKHSDLHLKLEFRKVPNLILRRTPIIAIFLPDTGDAVSAFRDEIGVLSRIGFSAPIVTLSRVPDAYREARWALDMAMESNKTIIEYGKDFGQSPFLPNTLSDANRIIEEILGPLLEYDATNNAQFVKSLDAFLSNQRSWKKTASVLHIHYQTLRYRMRHVERLTNRKLNETQDVAELWFALRAAKNMKQL